MDAALLNIHISQGSDYRRLITIKEDGVARNLTNHSCKAQIKSKFNDSTILAEFNVTIIPTLGEIALHLPNSVTNNLKYNCFPENIPTGFSTLQPTQLTPIKYYRYDVELIYPSGDVRRILYGCVIVSAQVTQE